MLQGPDLHALLISALLVILVVFVQILNTLCKCVHQYSLCVWIWHTGGLANMSTDLNNFPPIEEVTCSLSKTIFYLKNRVGIRWTKNYVDDGVSMLNEVKMQNNYSMALGVEYMKHFNPDYNWEKYNNKYENVCHENDCMDRHSYIWIR